MNSLVDIIRLIRTKNVGNVAFFELLNHFGSAKKAIEALPNLVTRNATQKFFVCSVEEAEQEIETCSKLGINIITYQDLSYPPLMQHVDGKPPVLFAKGDLSLLGKLPVAVVGSRQVSLNGLSITRNLVRELTKLGILIVSGMATGVDACAHEVALDTGTVAFLGSGVNVPFPPQNIQLYKKIVQQGLVLSSFPPNTQPFAGHFPQRNTYIAAMSLGVLVIEAKIKSGSLITAYSSMNYNREVFAVPGNPQESSSHGCNKLLKEGAILVESIDDMLETIYKWKENLDYLKEEQTTKPHHEELRPNTDASKLLEDSSRIHQHLIKVLSQTPVGIDVINEHFKDIPNSEISLSILELELSGKITRMPGNKIKLVNLNDK